MRALTRSLGLLFLLLPLVSSCGKKKSNDDPVESKQFQLTPEERNWWITKVVRKLRNGKGLASDAELAQWSSKSDDQIVEDLMADPTFYETVLDFNLYYLGFKNDRTKFPDPNEPLSFGFLDPNPSIYRHHVAIAGAVGIRDGKDFFDMLRADVPLVKAPYGPVNRFGDEQFDIISDKERVLKIRNKLFAQYSSNADALIALAQGEVKGSQYCALKKELSDRALNRAGIDYEFLDSTFYGPDVFSLNVLCPEVAPPQDPVATAEQKASMIKFANAVKALVARLPEGDWNHYFPQHLSELKFEENKPKDSYMRFQKSWSWLWFTMPNSSTNSNRKRAAYALKRFFCDDLTPLNVISSQDQHPTNRHASDPSCQSCHYKLDPMAGLFKNIDGSGDEILQSNAGPTEIYFSDGAKKNLAEYLSQWKGEHRTWNVGYIRSLVKTELNDYTEHPENPKLDDLFAIIRRAPEARECLTRRMFEYFVGDQQTADPGYLVHLTSVYNETAKSDPAKAFKDTMKAVVQSHTFQTQNAEPSECYDFAPGVNAEDRPPCRVAFILERNCVSCHKASGASGGLDLGSWVNVEGSEKSFAHHSSDGSQKKKSETFQTIMDRLQSTDTAKRMPLNAAMSDQDRSALYLWLNQELSKQSH